jgi:predicted RNase H-like HicB family nuclease
VNKNLDYYMSLHYQTTLAWDEDNEWIARHPELDGCIGDGATEEEAIASLRISKKLWLMTALDQNLPIPEPIGEAL